MRFPETLDDFPRSIFGAHAQLLRARTEAPAAADLEARVRRLEADLAVRDLVAAYMVAFDAKDIELLLSLYGPDAVLVNSFGTWRGPTAIRESHEFDLANNVYSFHNLANLVTTFDRTGTEAWVGGYLYNVVDREGAVVGSVATCLFHVQDSAAGWRIAECRTAPTGRHALPEAVVKPVSGRPVPTEAQTSNDLTGG